ncbi:tetratricopeptide repeat protein [Kangiella shandongensis]|uniref:tetratricopeptide repeat protein n=1 Tax=Kangiella shandongensis TaxID=2763258 RepID=UPI001CBF24E2|nr:hypothetical protein [Kangiella shandongensis]
MVINKRYQLIPVALSLLLVSSLSFAKQWVPQSEEEVVLHYEPNRMSPLTMTVQSSTQPNPQRLLTMMSKLIQQSQYPGQSHALNDASVMLKRLAPMMHSLNKEQQAQYTIAKANIAQQSHHFQRALDLLSNVKDSSEHYPQALLIQSRLLLIQGNYPAAEKACRKLISYHIQAGELCTIEVKIYQRSSNTAQSLSILRERYTADNDPLTRYFHQIQGTSFRIEQNYQKAEEAFSYDLLNAPSSQWYQWADMAFANQRPQKVYQALKALIPSADNNLEDGFIMRLARAEKEMQLVPANYQKLAQQLVELRQRRNDKLHAADIAYYFIFIAQNPEQALKWAKLNWQQVKEPSDKHILQQASAMNNK